MTQTQRILIADPIAPEGEAILSKHPAIAVDVVTGLSEADLCARIGDYNALIVRSKTKVTRSVIAAGHRLKAIGRAGIGVDNIDLEAATERGIVVFNTPDSNATTTAELALAHLFSLSRNLPQADRSVKSGAWQPSRYVGREITGKTVGIIGFGTIGRIFARRCLGLKMRVLVHDPFVTNEAVHEVGAVAADLDSLLQQSDYVSLHCPLMDSTRNLMNAERLARMKPGARLINCARGGLIDEAALFEAVKGGHLAGAALDVFAVEPPKDNPLLTLDNVVATPHLGASTEEAQTAVSIKIAEDMAEFFVTGTVQNAVNLPRLTSEQFDRTRPYQELARALGGFLAAIVTEPVCSIEVGLYGRAAECDPRPVTGQALVGLLSKRLAATVNQVNATYLSRRHGITVRETRSEDSGDYVALLQIRATTSNGTTSVAGTLLGGRQPRLVRIDDYMVEAVMEGHLLFTRHDDRPGVVGALGGILGREQINISRMQVGIANGRSEAIGLVGVSGPLPPAALEEIRALSAIHQVAQIEL